MGLVLFEFRNTNNKPHWLFYFLRQRRRLILTLLAFVFSKIHPIANDDTMEKVWFSLKTLDDVLWGHVVFLLIFILQSWYHFCSNFPHARIFRDNLPNTFFFHIQSTCNHLISQTPHTTWITSSKMTAVLLIEVFPSSWDHLSPPHTFLWTSCATKRLVSMWLGVIFIHFLKHFKCM